MPDGKLVSTVADPNWKENGGGGRGAQTKYETADKESILRTILRDSPWEPHEGQSIWMWATSNKLLDAFWVLEGMGVTYVTHAVWVKAHIINGAVYPQAPGIGQRMRMCHELLLYGRIGNVPVPPTHARLPSTIYAPRTERHSEKPDEAWRRIEIHDQLASRPGRRLELYSRNPRPGWEAWGRGVGGHVVPDDGAVVQHGGQPRLFDDA